MPIVAVERGDLLDMFKQSKFDAIAHGCNCYQVMGAGIAGQIAQEFPEVCEADRKNVIGDSESMLGGWTSAKTRFGTIFNLYTQIEPGRELREVLNYSIRRAFEGLDIRVGIGQFTGNKIGIPLIGCGIAGGDWDEVSEIINDVTPNLNIVVVEYFQKMNPKPAMKLPKRALREPESIVEYWLG